MSPIPNWRLHYLDFCLPLSNAYFEVVVILDSISEIDFEIIWMDTKRYFKS